MWIGSLISEEAIHEDKMMARFDPINFGMQTCNTGSKKKLLLASFEGLKAFKLVKIKERKHTRTLICCRKFLACIKGSHGLRQY